MGSTLLGQSVIHLLVVTWLTMVLVIFIGSLQTTTTQNVVHGKLIFIPEGAVSCVSTTQWLIYQGRHILGGMLWGCVAGTPHLRNTNLYTSL